MVYSNVVIGKPLVNPAELLAYNSDDWESSESGQTLFTEERSLPAIMKEAGIVKSISEVRRNQPKLMITLNEVDCLEIKWGKRRLFIVVGK